MISMINSSKNIETFLGDLIIDEQKRLAYSQFINLDSIENKEIYTIAKELMEPVFSLEGLALKYNKKVALKAIELSLIACEKGKMYGSGPL